MADSAELTVLAKALNDYCARHRIKCEEERERIGRKLMCVFWRGVTDPDQLSAELERARPSKL